MCTCWNVLIHVRAILSTAVKLDQPLGCSSVWLMPSSEVFTSRSSEYRHRFFGFSLRHLRNNPPWSLCPTRSQHNAVITTLTKNVCTLILKDFLDFNKQYKYGMQMGLSPKSCQPIISSFVQYIYRTVPDSTIEELVVVCSINSDLRCL